MKCDNDDVKRILEVRKRKDSMKFNKKERKAMIGSLIRQLYFDEFISWVQCGCVATQRDNARTETLNF